MQGNGRARSPHRSASRTLAQGALVALLAGAAGCSGSLSTLSPSGPAAGSIATLWWVMLAGACVLFALVMGLFLLVIKRPGWGSRVSPARWIVLGGLALPAVVLTAWLTTWWGLLGLLALVVVIGPVREVASGGRGRALIKVLKLTGLAELAAAAGLAAGLALGG